MLTLFYGACSDHYESMKLEPGMPEYDFAKDLAKIVPFLDPDSNNAVVSAKGFDVTTGEVIYKLRNRLGNQASSLRGYKPEVLKKAILDNAIDAGEKKLVMAEVEEAGFEIPEVMVDSVMSLYYARVGNEKIFRFRMEKSGSSVQNLRDEVRTILTVQHYLEEVALKDEIAVSEDEIRAVYEADKYATVRHLLLRTKKGMSEAEKKKVRKKIERLLRRVKRGEDFAKLVKKYSEDPGLDKNDGLYTFEREEMPPEFEEAAFTLPVGTFSDIVETRYGYHIIEVIDRNKEEKTYEEVREEIRERLKNDKLSDAYEGYLENLKKKKAFTVVDF